MANPLPDIDELLAGASRADASDLHLKTGLPPVVRIDGELHATNYVSLQSIDVERYLEEIIPDHVRGDFKERYEADFAYGDERGVGRFRVNAYRQRGAVSIAFRRILPPESNFEELGLPPVMNQLAAEPRGLILVTGPTGSGKSTTLAAMIDDINAKRRVNIITIEDPIEVIHRDKRSMVSQREVGTDTLGFSEALRRVLRQDPDVILIGEMRDMETIDAALKAAETGHLVLSTLHTLDATETINRILDFFPSEHQRQVRLLLAGSLRGIVSQRLIPRADGDGRVPAVEVLVNTERVAERIADPEKTHQIADIVADGDFYGMTTFDQSILELVKQGTITMTEAMRHATKPADLKLRAQQMGF
ncbi:MAG: type IV pilus twitching motility protein PilT [Acidimicrobiia bacterium]|nr:type IV pilus twitching motility protein PilT [Acidimicrobiia bacterium]